MNRTYISELDLYVRIKQEPKRTYIRFYGLNNELVLSYRFETMSARTCGFGIGRYIQQILKDYQDHELPHFEMVGQFSLKGDK